jgi:phosphoglycerate dehydrogenase-like enzyme
MKKPMKILITFHLAPELIEDIKAVDGNLEIMYDPTLLGTPRYLNDQHGSPFNRSSEQEDRFRSMMAEAEILFGYIPQGYQADIKKWFPKLKWNQSPSAGIGWGAKRYNWTDTDIVFTTASGIHETPLAEFCIMSMLMFVKDYFWMEEEKKRKHWARTCSTELRGKTLAIIGLGKVGREIARIAKCMGMRVLATKKHTEGVDPQSIGVDEVYPGNNLDPILRESDFLTLICPETEETRGLIGRNELMKMKKGAVLINIARGSIVDEDALIEALRMDHLGGAALDVFRVEPLPPESPLWEMPHVIISPHSASTADTENMKQAKLFIYNLTRYLKREPLRNVLDKNLLY